MRKIIPIVDFQHKERLRALDRQLGELLDRRDLLELQEKSCEARHAKIKSDRADYFITRYERDCVLAKYDALLADIHEKMRAVDAELFAVRSEAARLMNPPDKLP